MNAKTRTQTTIGNVGSPECDERVKNTNTNYYRKCVLKTFIARILSKSQTEIESVIVSVIKTRPTHADSMAY